QKKERKKKKNLPGHSCQESDTLRLKADSSHVKVFATWKHLKKIHIARRYAENRVDLQGNVTAGGLFGLKFEVRGA
uniref:Uncharacterized protein n=1 Tax=Tetraodon nigroviridis TaxID=99883 RepID=H3C106_TETNG